MGGITIGTAAGEQVLMGEHDGARVIVLGVKPDQESARLSWDAARSLIETLYVGSPPPLVIVDIPNASIRHGFVTEMPSGE